MENSGLPELTVIQRKLAAALLQEMADLCASQVSDEIDLSQILDTSQERQIVIREALTFGDEEVELQTDYDYVSISDYHLAEWLASVLYPKKSGNNGCQLT